MAHWKLDSDSCRFELWKRVFQKRSPSGFRGSARNWSAVGKVGEIARVASLDRIALEPMNAPRQMLRIIFESWPGFWVYIRMRGGAFSRGPGVLTPILLFSTRTRVNLNACVARKGAFSHARNGSATACNRIFRPNDRARNAYFHTITHFNHLREFARFADFNGRTAPSKAKRPISVSLFHDRSCHAKLWIARNWSKWSKIERIYLSGGTL